MRDMMMRAAIGRDTTLAWQYEHALARFAGCCECGRSDAAMVPQTSDDTGDLQFACVDKRVCHFWRQTRSLLAAGVVL